MDSAGAIQNQTPLINTKRLVLRKRYQRIKEFLATADDGARRSLAFISHDKQDAAIQGRYLRDKICAILDAPFDDIFLEIEEQPIGFLLNRVRNTGCVVLLQTRNVLHRSFCLAELNEAVVSSIPIVSVYLLGGLYSYEQAEALLASPNFVGELAAVNPGGIGVLESQGLDVAVLAQHLYEVIPKSVSTPLNIANVGDQVLEANVVEIVDAILTRIETRHGLLPIDSYEKQKRRRRIRRVGGGLVILLILAGVAIALGLTLTIGPSLMAESDVLLSSIKLGENLGNISWIGSFLAISSDARYIAAGAPGNNAIWIFDKVGTGYNAIQLTSNFSGFAGFGSSVALDATGSTLLVSLVPASTDRPLALLYTRVNDSSWSYWVDLPSTNFVGLPFTNFLGTADTPGSSVGLSAAGDIAIVGVSNDNDNQGAVFSFILQNGNWSQMTSKITVNDKGVTALGMTLACDAMARILVVAGTKTFGQNIVYVFVRSGFEWSQQASTVVTAILPTNGVFQPQLQTVAVSSQGNDILVANPFNKNTLVEFTVSNNSVKLGAVTSPFAEELYNFLGSTVSINANASIAIVGNNIDSSSGFVWLCKRSESTGEWVVVAKLEDLFAMQPGALSNPFENAGTAVAISADGTTAVVGAPGDAIGSGAVFVLNIKL